MLMFVFTIILMASLSAALYLAAQALPRVAEEPEGDPSSGAQSWWIRSRIPERIDAALNGFLFKFLRKVKVAVLKIDNALSAHLERVKPEGNGKKPAIDFKEIAGQNKNGGNDSGSA